MNRKNIRKAVLGALALAAIVALVVAGRRLVADPSWDGPRSGTKDAVGVPPETVDAQNASGANEGGERAAAPIASTPFQDAAASALANPAGPDDFVMVGRIVDDARRAAPHVSVMATVDSRWSGRATSAADGSFRVVFAGARASIKAPALFAVHADDGRGRAAFLESSIIAAREDDAYHVGSLALLPARAFTVRATHDGVGVEGARVYVGTRYRLGLGPFVTGSDGRSPPFRVGDGVYDVAVFADGGLRADVRFDFNPSANDAIEAALAPAWNLEVFVKNETTGAPVAGAIVALRSTERASSGMIASISPMPPGPPLRTNKDGLCVVEGLSTARLVTVRVLPDEHAPWSVADSGNSATANPGDARVVVALDVVDGMAFPIVDGATEGPADGAAVTLTPFLGGSLRYALPTARVVGGRLVLEGAPRRLAAYWATTEDGRGARVRITKAVVLGELGEPIQFEAARKLVVALKESDGTPVVGWDVGVRSDAGTAGPFQVSDADGVARFEGLPAIAYSAFARPPGGASEFRTTLEIGSADLLTRGEARIDYVLEPAIEVVARVVIDGEPRLPTGYTLACARGVFGPVEEDPDAATLRFTYRPATAGGCFIRFDAVGFLPFEHKFVAPVAGGRAAFEVKLTTELIAQVEVAPPADGRHEMELQRRDEAVGQWKTVQSTMFRPPDAPERLLDSGRKLVTFPKLAKGRYRACDASTGIVGDAFDVPGDGGPRPFLDLSRAGFLIVRVEGPGDFASESATVRATGDGLVRTNRGGVGVPINKTAKVRIPGDRPVTVSVEHSLLVPSKDGASVVVTSPNTPVTLRLELGAVATFRTAEADETSKRRSATVELDHKDAKDRPRRTSKISVEGGVGRFGGFEPGRYDVTVDMPDFGPIVLRDVALGPGTTDLGTLTFPKGASLRVTFQIASTMKRRIALVTARPAAGGAGERWVTPSCEVVDGRVKEAVLSGLGAGLFVVEVHDVDRAILARSAVESKGSGEIDLAIELR